MTNRTRGIYIQGCARSGNTLTRELCCSAFHDTELVKLTKNQAECSLAYLVNLLQQSARHKPVFVASRNREDSLDMDGGLLRTNPDVKILWMLRDPRDVLTSIHAAQPNEFYVKPDRLIKSLNLYQQFKDEPQVLTIRYEDLVQNPDALQLRIAEFCHLTVRRKFDEAHKFFPRFHENVRAMHSIRPIDVNSLHKWRNNPVYQDHLRQTFAINPEIPALARDCGYEINL